MTPQTTIIIGGMFNVAFVIFHLFFWKLFDWKTDLASLSFINRAVMQILNLCLTFAFIIFAYISFFHTTEILTTGLGQSLLILVSIFWFLRAIEQIIFFGLQKIRSALFFVVFMVGGLIYIYPVLM